MTIEEIRKNAPEGATHWDEFYRFVSFYRVGNIIEIWEFNKFEYFDEIGNLHTHQLKPL